MSRTTAVTARTVRASRAGLLNGSVVSEDLDGDPEVACGVEVRHPAAADLPRRITASSRSSWATVPWKWLRRLRTGLVARPRARSHRAVRPVDHAQADLLGETVGILGRG